MWQAWCIWWLCRDDGYEVFSPVTALVVARLPWEWAAWLLAVVLQCDYDVME